MIQKCEIENCQNVACYSHKAIGMVIQVCQACQAKTQIMMMDMNIEFEKFRQKKYLEIIAERK